MPSDAADATPGFRIKPPQFSGPIGVDAAPEAECGMCGGDTFATINTLTTEGVRCARCRVERGPFEMLGVGP